VSIASQFRDKMDIALASADRTRGADADLRRAELLRDLDKADFALMDKESVRALMDTITTLKIAKIATLAPQGDVQ
jgi:hypothetical protein